MLPTYYKSVLLDRGVYFYYEEIACENTANDEKKLSSVKLFICIILY